MLTPWQRDLAMRKNVLLDNLFRNQFQAAAIKGTVFLCFFFPLIYFIFGLTMLTIC